VNQQLTITDGHKEDEKEDDDFIDEKEDDDVETRSYSTCRGRVHIRDSPRIKL
jgi:hypothetical protein